MQQVIDFFTEQKQSLLKIHYQMITIEVTWESNPYSVPVVSNQ